MSKRFYLGAVLAAPIVMGAALATLSFQPGSRVWVQGTSTVRSWRCETTQVEGSAQAATTDLSQLRSVPGGQVTLSVASLDCRNQTMNGHMRRALKSDEAPTLHFRATGIEVSGGAAKMQGELTMAGTTRPVTFEGTVANEDGALRVRGTKQIVMTEWGVRPPSLMMGTMKVNPAATIGFDVVLKP